MKKSSRKTTFLSALAIAVPAMGMAQDKVEATRAEMNQGYRAHEALLQQAENIARSLPEPTCTILRSCYWEISLMPVSAATQVLS